ncbi:MAG TPA: PQQ-binding-like beta-propeller repeat protein [Acidimicrobiia bacterium]
MTRRCGVVVVMLVVVLAGCDWTAYLYSPGHTSAADDGGFSTGNVGAAVQRWRWTPDPPPPGATNEIYASPVTWKGRVFIGVNSGDFYALSLDTGQVLWKRSFGFQPALTCAAAGIAATAAVRDDGNGNPLVYVNAPDGYVYELDGLTGATVWRNVVAIPSTTVNDAYAWSSVTLASNRVYVGMTSNCDNPFIRGGVKAFDPVTGQLMATYYSEPAGSVGAGVWTTPAADGSSVFATTGSANDANPPPGDQYSLVKLDPVTLARTGIFHVPDATGPDLDFGSSPVLFHATIGGTDTPLVGACSKNGYFYAVRRDTMQLVWKRMLGVGTAYGQTACFSGGVFGGGLYVGGPQTTIGGKTVAGSVRSLDPATGAIRWELPVVADPLGAGALDNSGVLAYSTTDWTRTANDCYLLEASTGRVLRAIPSPGNAPAFSQPVWVDGKLLVANFDSLGAYW